MTDTRDYDLGPYFCENPHHALLHHCLERVRGRAGIGVEFGVGEGHSLRCIAQSMPVMGFDSFQGLPEDWRPGFGEGMFACDPPRDLPGDTKLVVGLFEDTLHPTFWAGIRPIKLVHIDCDLYSSTATVLERLPWRNLIRNKAVIVFDEYWGYPEAEKHEQRAWMEFTDENPDLQWEVIGHGVQQWGIQLV